MSNTNLLWTLPRSPHLPFFKTVTWTTNQLSISLNERRNNTFPPAPKTTTVASVNYATPGHFSRFAVFSPTCERSLLQALRMLKKSFRDACKKYTSPFPAIKNAAAAKKFASKNNRKKNNRSILFVSEENRSAILFLPAAILTGMGGTAHASEWFPTDQSDKSLLCCILQ